MFGSGFSGVIPGPHLDPVLVLVGDHDGAVECGCGMPEIEVIEVRGVVPGAVLRAERHEHLPPVDDVERLARVRGIAAPRPWKG